MKNNKLKKDKESDENLKSALLKILLDLDVDVSEIDSTHILDTQVKQDNTPQAENTENLEK